jgi:Uncharacterized protein conserved in bacteria (DUF2059).
MRTLILIAAAMSLMLAQPVQAQEQARNADQTASASSSTEAPAGLSKAERTSVAQQDGSDAHRLALSRRYVELMQGDQLTQHMRTMIETSVAGDADSQGMSAEDHAFMLDLTTDLVTDLVPQMLDRMVPVIAQTFTAEELQALVGFYDNPVGQEILRKSYVMAPQMNEAVMALMPQLFDKMALRICDHYGCDAEEVRSAMLDGAGLTSMPAAGTEPGKL